MPILSVNWVYQLTWYKLSPMKWSNTENVQKIDKRTTPVGGARRSEHVLLTPIGGTSIEWVKQHVHILFGYIHIIPVQLFGLAVLAVS